MSRRPRLTRGELKKKEELEHLSLVEEELMDKLKSERGKRDRVQHDNDLKNEHLKKLQKKLERLIRDQTAELEAEESKTQQMSDNADDTMRTLQKSKEQYTITLESYPVIDRENTNLRHTVNNLKEELSVLRAKNATELTSLKKEMFDIRMKIEFEFMRTKKNYERQYEENAQSQMKSESEKAVVECARLSSILKSKKSTVEALMKSQESKASLLQKSRVEKVLGGSALEMQQSEIELLERLMKEQEVIIQKCQSEITSLHHSLKSLQKQEKDLVASTSTLNSTRTSYSLASVEKNSWKSKVKNLVLEVDAWISRDCPLESKVGFIESVESYYDDKSSKVSEIYEEEEEEEEEGGEEIWRASRANDTMNNTTQNPQIF
ncbi:hypothetical protein TrVE_jg5638 [Triparma verrucosa]|uniref:Uncharacterized protein n=1 Tax=Triparma verrucosa TaxID=1606542 RepID=A0A9W7FE28_9STRA|nr:hypothetical protein TrVE_jg5638 [Triparma verrucosa]